MCRFLRHVLLLTLSCTASVLCLTPSSRGETAAPPVDFNRDIRPLLAQRCLACHGRDESTRQGGFRLDDRQSATGEADSGAVVIVPGKPDESELIARVSSDDEDLRMPPADTGVQLTEDQIALLRRWIEQDALYARHWSFTKPQRPVLPAVQNQAWPSNPIDYFVLHKLETEGLQPNPPADRYAIIRRLSLDLRGLPPSWQEVEAFVADGAPDAYERLVDQMLADPAYGQRWARVWLDLARYADSRGYGSDPLRPNMWRYRDWVIDALNQNMPFDEFTIEQLAGDLLPEPTLEQKMATAFNRNTMTNTEGGTDDEEYRVAAVKDRVDTTIQVWMGLTMGCAKCHSHKYDPISQREYYQLFAIFNQTKDNDQPDETPTIEAPRAEDVQALQAYTTELGQLEQQLAEVQQQIETPPPSDPTPTVQGRFVRIQLPGDSRILSLAEVEVFQGETNLAVQGQATQVSTAYEGPAELALDGKTDGDFYAAKSTTHTQQQSDPWWEVDLGAVHAVDRVVVWNRTDNALEDRLAPWQVVLLDDARNPVWQMSVDEPPRPSRELALRAVTPLEQRRVELEQQIAQRKKARPTVPTLPVMEQRAADQQRTTHLLVKGDFLTKGEVVEPGVLQSFHPLSSGVKPDRLSLARWIVDPENPLTARVTVNRLWARIFGTGIVATEEDFGTQGDVPSHEELLDWLAAELVRSQWDIKQMLKLMVNSASYRQSAQMRPELLAKDPRNRWLGRGPRVRLDAEAVRDQALALSGLLSPKIGGPSVYPYQPPGLWRAAFNGERTWPTSQGEDRYRLALYTFWRRTVPYPSMATFDAPSRELCTLRRVRTNTPLQAFVCLNDPVYVEAAQALARRLVQEGGDSVADRVTYGLKLCLCRPPTSNQVEVLTRLHGSEYEHYQADVTAAQQIATDPLGPLPPGSDVGDMAAWTVVANVLLNIDSVLNN